MPTITKVVDAVGNVAPMIGNAITALNIVLTIVGTKLENDEFCKRILEEIPPIQDMLEKHKKTIEMNEGFKVSPESVTNLNVSVEELRKWLESYNQKTIVSKFILSASHKKNGSKLLDEVIRRKDTFVQQMSLAFSQQGIELMKKGIKIAEENKENLELMNAFNEMNAFKLWPKEETIMMWNEFIK